VAVFAGIMVRTLHHKDDWKRMQDEVADWGARYDALMGAGEPPTGERAVAMAEEHRRHITKWFYDCTPEIHRGFGDLYMSDERFREFYDSMRPGLAEHVRAAIHANADRVG
jgi:MerR family transcriptional regulator, thiopeptide resistance regulator